MEETPGLPTVSQPAASSLRESTEAINPLAPKSYAEPLTRVMLRTAVTSFVATLTVVVVMVVSSILIIRQLQPSAEEQAINLAKGYNGGSWQMLLEKLTGVKTPDAFAQARLPNDVKKVHGWQAERKDDKYLVSFTWETKDEQEGMVRGYWFEVDVSQGIVLPVTGNPELEKKYGLKRVE